MDSNSVEELAAQILRHKKLYYNGEPIISDAEYDQLEDTLRQLDPDNPVLHLVGTPAGGKVQHSPPMLSSQKATTLAEVTKWANDISMGQITAGYKVDGLSLSIIYNNGQLRQGATRGNGQSGDDVTLECMKIQGIPQTIPVTEAVNVRGEVYMTISEFERVNSRLPKADQYSSPRNLAAGTLKQKSLRVLDNRKLQFMAWQLVGHRQDMTNMEQMKLLKSWGFDIADRVLMESPTSEEIDDVFKGFVDERGSLDFEIDGIIFKYNLASDRDSAGFTEHHPKWSIAWKFQSKGEITTVNAITWQVGRTGVITPVAEVEPVEVAGATIRRATLHNAEMIETLEVAPGDQVSLIRAGDVIPKILEVVEKGDQNYTFPEVCPSCGSLAKRDGVDLRCTGITCRERDIQRINYWIRQTEIKGLGGKSVEKLYDKGLLAHYSDLYALSETMLETHLGVNGLKIFEEIEKTRELPFATFLAALGIQNLGPKMGKVLADRYSSYQELKTTNKGELVKLEGVSDLTAAYILEGVNDPETGDKILAHDITLLSPQEQRKKRKKKVSRGLDAWFGDGDEIEEEDLDGVEDSTFGGKKIYVTGSVEGYSKKDLEMELEVRGVIWHKSISSNLDFLVYGANAGQKKLDEADRRGISRLSWAEFNSKLDNPLT
jgi:DNA ligase (NAD+)